MQDYAKAIYTLESRDGAASTTDLAALLEVRPASVSGMLRKLSALGLVEHERYHGVRLTERGRRVALEVIRHHRLVELFLVESLGMTWDEVHAEAEVLEHALSEELEELIAAKLGNPTVDPHGDPIPSRELKLAETPAPALASSSPATTATFVRISDAEPEMLRFLGERGIVPGTKLELVERQPFDGPLFVRVGRKVHAARGRARAGDARGGCVTPVETLCDRSARSRRITPLEALLRRGRLRATLTMLGPAFVAAIAYVDPGNFATNIQGGARFGYLLLWVVLAANLMAMLIQYLSAKLGIVTDRNLPESFRAHYPRWMSWGMWVQAELISMSTDIAEFLGAALGLNLLFHVPLFIAGVMTGFIAFGLLELRRRGYRPFELAITALLGIIFLGFLYETLKIGPSAHGQPPELPAASARLDRGAVPRGRDHRRDRHAARHLSPLRAHQGPHARPQRRRALAACSASSAPT